MPESAQTETPAEPGQGLHDLIVLSLAFFFTFMGPAAVQQFLGPYLVEETGLSRQVCSWVLASVYFSCVFWRLLCGYTAHFLGGRGSIVFGLCTYTGFAGCIYFFPNYWTALAAAMVWGWGAAAIWVAGPTRILENQSALKRGRASGIFYTSVYLGQAIGVLLLGWLGNKWGRPWIFGVAAAIGLLANGISLFVRRTEAEPTKPNVWDVLSVMRGKRGIILCGILFTSSMSFGIVLGPLNSTVDEIAGFTQISSLTIGFYVGRLIVGWVAGWCTDRFGRTPVLAFAFFVGAAGLTIAAASTTSVPLALAAFSLGIQAGIVHIPVMALVGDWIEPERRHLAFGALYAWGNLARGFAIAFGETLRSALGGAQVAFGVFAVMMAICGVLSIVVGRQSSA